MVRLASTVHSLASILSFISSYSSICPLFQPGSGVISMPLCYSSKASGAYPCADCSVTHLSMCYNNSNTLMPGIKDFQWYLTLSKMSLIWRNTCLWVHLPNRSNLTFISHLQYSMGSRATAISESNTFVLPVTVIHLRKQLTSNTTNFTSRR